MSVFSVAVVASLLAFPNARLWMIAGWLAVATIAVFRRRAAWIPLIVCLVVTVIKRPDWSPTLTALVVSMIGVAVALHWSQKPGEATGGRHKLALGAVCLLWLMWLGVLWRSQIDTLADHDARFDRSRPIVCLGDSLTSGMSDDESFPNYLQLLVSVPVLNFGRAGITARDAIKLLPAILKEHPQVVVIELGGHDYLRGYGRDKARASLVEIIESCRNAGAAVVLMEIPRGFISDSFSGLERELARQYDLELIPDTVVRMLVLRSSTFPLLGTLAAPHLSDDGLHPNVAGARYLAEQVCQALDRMYGSGVKAERLR